MLAAIPFQDHSGSPLVSRRDFVRLCSMAAAAVGLGPIAAERFLEAAARGVKPSVVEVLRTVHSFDPCIACAIHTLDLDGRELSRVRAL
jgi:Ni,Fe-hydrogenase I large subunit